MKKNFMIKHEFVEFIPEVLSAGVIYVSIPYATASHSCFCGCGSRVVTPLSREGWSVTFDGESISLSPSIGNYGLPCQSHYFVRNDKVIWARHLSKKEIDADRRKDDLLPLKGPQRINADERAPHLGRRFLDWLRGI